MNAFFIVLLSVLGFAIFLIILGSFICGIINSYYDRKEKFIANVVSMLLKHGKEEKNADNKRKEERAGQS